MFHPSGVTRHAAPPVWATDRLTRRQFARARFKLAQRMAAGVWGKLVTASPHLHPTDDPAGQFQMIELGDALLSTLDLGGGAQGWHFAPRPGAAVPLMLVRAIRGGWLQEDGGPRLALPAGQIALIPLTTGLELDLPQGGRCDVGLIQTLPGRNPGLRVLTGAIPSAHHLAFVAGYLLRCAPHPAGRTDELKQMLFRALDHVLSDLEQSAARGSETPFERFKFLIAANLGRADLTLDEIAAAMRLGPRQLQRLLQAQGTSFRLYLHLRRLEHAHELITAAGPNRLRVADLAWRCGFRDPNYFSRAYSQHWKVPPSRD